MTLATLEEWPLPAGEPATDKGYHDLDSGAYYRVRVVRAEELAADIATNDGSAVQPYGFALDISLAEIEPDGTVKRDAEGRVAIPANTRWTVDEPVLLKPGFDMEADLMTAIRTLAAEADARRTAKADALAYLTNWGLGSPA